MSEDLTAERLKAWREGLKAAIDVVQDARAYHERRKVKAAEAACRHLAESLSALYHRTGSVVAHDDPA